MPGHLRPPGVRVLGALSDLRFYDALNDERRFHWYYVDCNGHVAALYWDDDNRMKVFRRLKREDFRDHDHLRRDHLEFLEKRGLLPPKPEG